MSGIDLMEEIRLATSDDPKPARHELLDLPAPAGGRTALLKKIQSQFTLSYPDLLQTAASDPAARRELLSRIRASLLEEKAGLVGFALDALVQQIYEYLCGYGPLESLINRPEVTEIMVNDFDQVFIEVGGKLEPTTVKFKDREHVVNVAQRIVGPLGRELSMATPYVDGRIANSIRVTATVPPFSRTPTITMRKHNVLDLSTEDYLSMGVASEEMLEFLRLCVRGRANFVVAGPTGTGKTTLVRYLARYIPPDERIITIEETCELHLREVHPHVVELECREANKEGTGAIPADEALRQALHMRPDRIVLGEVRHKEALQLLVAMATGHRGSFTTVHSDSPMDVFDRLVFAMLQGNLQMSRTELLRYVTRAVDLVVYLERLEDGSRKITSVAQVEGASDESARLTELFAFVPSDVSREKVSGRFEAVGTPHGRLLARLFRRGVTPL